MPTCIWESESHSPLLQLISRALMEKKTIAVQPCIQDELYTDARERMGIYFTEPSLAARDRLWYYPAAVTPTTLNGKN